MLTGKAKEDFKSWLAEESEKYHQHEWLDNDMYLDEICLPPPIENCLILEWLDSVCIYLCIGRFGYSINTYRREINKKVDGDRQFITEIAIEQANKIYNER